ncbi:hypothetical protein DFH08DRAFT_743306 [Mycena albidolilacea]|uniref:Uncharacterized protein n=1 Tax=Mycena albidolilacea TaxID=1033008 RepID=A0AAD7A4E8_9AGAR|nr:hypothetical protein DFH08DRAFT_743306 [Mycena albidolilacea]
MWTKFSSALKSKQAQDGEASGTEALAGPSSSSPVKRKSVLKRDDGSLRLNSPLKLASIPKKVKTTFNLHVNTSQLTLSAEPLPSSSSSRDLARRSSQDLLSSNTAPRPKAARRSSFNILTRRPSLDLLRSPPETPRSTPREEPSDATCGRNRAATFEGSVRSILREPNTPVTAKSVRFGRDADTVAWESAEATFSRSTPPEQVFLDRLQQAGSTSTSMPRLASSSRSNRPSVIEIFAPSTDPSQSSEPDLTSLFQGLDIPPISSLSTGLHVPNSDLPAALTSTPHKDGNKGSSGPSREDVVPESTNLLSKTKPSRLAPRSHDRSASFSFGQTVFHATADDSASNRSSSGNSSLISDSDSNMTSSSSSPSVSRNRAFSDTAFMSMLRGSSSKTSPKVAQPSISESYDMVTTTDSIASVPDPFSADATTYYTPQTMINTTPPGSQSRSRHVRTASREESLIFSLQTQLDLQTELCGQFEADLHARDELVEVLRNKLIEAEEDDAKKVRFLRAWKKKVAELERTCQFLEDEVEGSRQESMDRSVMDEASSEALRMLHRQIAALERERDAWRRTEAVLREELRRLETLASERRNEAVRLRSSLGSLSDKQAQERMAEEALKAAVASLEKSGEEQKQRHEAAEMAWRVENEDLQRNNAELVDELLVSKQRLSARDDEIAELKAELVATRDRAVRTVEATEAGKCALAMERDSLKLQVAKLQEKHLRTEVAEQKALELEDDLRGVWDVKQSLEKERDQLKVQLKGSENRALELEQERQYALDSVSRLEDNIRRRDLGAATEMQEFREQTNRLKQEHAAALEAALQDGVQKRLEIDAQTTTLIGLQTEVERLKGQTRELQQESADKEVHILQITKQHAQDKQDLEGLNIALDSKQQELELLKRRLGVRGTAGNTPSQSSKPTHTHRRRESSVSVAPRMSRPSSFTSEFGVDLTRERKPSAEGSPKIAALSKSTRLNTSTSVLPTPSKRGSMGPPPLRSRSSIVGTPTIASRTLNRSSSATVVAGKVKTVKSPTAASPPSPATQQNKENTDALRRASDVPPASRRLSTSRIPIPTFAQ